MKKAIFLLAIMLMTLSAPVSAALIDLAPADSPFILEMNIGKLLAFDPLKAVIEEQLNPAAPEGKAALEAFMEKFGFDPFKHLANALLFSSKDAFKSESPFAHIGVLLDGSFNLTKIYDSMKSDPDLAATFDLLDFEGFTALSLKDGEHKLVFLDDRTVILGTDAIIKMVLDVKNNKSEALSSKAAFRRLLAHSDLTSPIWGCGTITPDMKAKLKADAVGAPLAGIDAVLLAVTLGENFGMEATAETAMPQDTQAVIECVKNYILAFKAWAADVPELVKVFDQIKFSTNGLTAKFSLSLSKAEFDKFISAMQKLAENPKEQPKDKPQN